MIQAEYMERYTTKQIPNVRKQKSPSIEGLAHMSDSFLCIVDDPAPRSHFSTHMSDS
jgi:hypothetical protein